MKYKYVTISKLGWIQLNTRVKAIRLIKRLKRNRCNIK